MNEWVSTSEERVDGGLSEAMARGWGAVLSGAMALQRRRPQAGWRTRLEHSTGALERSTGALERSTGALERSTGALERSTGALERSTGALERSTGGSEQREQQPLGRAGAFFPAAGRLDARAVGK